MIAPDRAHIDVPQPFHEELRSRSLPVLRWSALIYNTLYVAWSVFDYLLVPELWLPFLALRLAVAAAGVLLLLLAHRPRWRTRTWEIFWVWLFLCGGGIAFMLPWVGDAFLPYVMGFTVILLGSGVVPSWPPAWSISNVVAITTTLPLAFLLCPTNVSGQNGLTGSFFVATVLGLAVLATSFKYGLARRDYESRSELARASSELADALQRLEELDKLKSRFFANVSHELRTPLTLILAPVQRLASEPALREHHDELEIVARNAQRLLRLIDDLLDLSKLDAGGLRLRLEELDLAKLARSVFENSQPAAAAKCLEMRFEAEDGDETTVTGDAHRLEIVLTNLIGNALKYTPDGGRIEVTVRAAADGVEVSVADSGVGIAPENLANIFERFYQAEEGSRRNAGGVGIGLSLARELIELHGGSLAVESEVGRGTTFRFRVPFGESHFSPDVVDRRRGVAERRGEPRPGETPGRRAEDRPTPRPALEAIDAPTDALTALAEDPPIVFEGARRARVLIVEDQDDLRHFIADLLRREFDVLAADDGEAGWQAVRTERPDIVVSDVMMPGRTGTELCQAIKEDSQLGATPVILLTARVGSEATLEAYAHGADDFVAKPFHPRVLLARVRAQLRLRALGLELAEREKLAAVGTMAAGILHEVRNPVNAILAASDVLASGRSAPEKAARLIDVVRDGARRIEEITGALDTHARPAHDDRPIPCDLQSGLESSLRLLEHRLDGVELRRDYRSSRQPLGVPGRLNQVLLNLLDNALNAGARTLWLTVSESGARVRCSVADDGPGIAPEVAQRIFDPFFTTAEPGKGTGLGLYLCRSMIEEMGGRIWHEPRDGGGSRFVVELDAVDELRAG